MDEIRPAKVVIFGKEYEIKVFHYGDRWRAEGECVDRYFMGRSAKTYIKAVDNWRRLAKMYLDY